MEINNKTTNLLIGQMIKQPLKGIFMGGGAENNSQK